MHILGETFSNALMITGFVFVMMLVIEYLNVLTRGNWDRVLRQWKAGQLLLGAFLGATPGCLGAFAVVSLYMHRVVTVGTVVAAMVATSGDEAFVMLAMFPRQALILFAILFALGLLSGFITDLFTKGRLTQTIGHLDTYVASHEQEARCVPFSRKELTRQWKACSPQRGLLTLFLTLFLLGLLSGTLGHSHTLAGDPRAHGESAAPACAEQHDHAEHAPAEASAHGEWDWIRITLLLVALVGLAIVATVPDHFLEEHLWNHIARVHVWRIFLWTFGALLLVNLLLAHTETEALIRQGHIPLLLLACLLGLIPQSGPHMIFVTLYAQGGIPFSVLLASSIVQDGHGMIPLLSHSRRAFFAVKAVNLAVGLAIGLLGWLTGW